MQLDYSKKENTAQIIYGETLSSSINAELFKNKHIIILTNQRYYDRFFEKIHRVFAPQTIDWYICSNLLYGNHLQEFMDVLHFLGKFSPTKEFLFVAFGSEGVIQLTSFLQKTTVLSGTFWVLPTSLQAYAAALVEERYIYKRPTEILLKELNLPEKIFLDQTIIAGQSEGKLVDLQVFIRTGLVCSYPFLRKIFKSFSTKKQLQATSFMAFVEELTDFYRASSKEIEGYGKVFEEAFYLTENGHMLSENMKRFLGMLLHLVWNLQIIESTFHIKNFLIWLKYLGFPVYFPEQISKAEYLENVLILQNKYPDLVILSEIGTIGSTQRISEKELLQAMETYQRIILEIEG